MTNMELISRQEAKAQGLKRYFTGEPCRRGHVSERIVSICKCGAVRKQRPEVKAREKIVSKAWAAKKGGLHVIENLQILTAAENQSKGNIALHTVTK